MLIETREINGGSQWQREKREKKIHSGNGKRKSRLSEAHEARDTSSPVLCSTVPASPSTPHSRVHTCTPRSILLSSGSTGIPPQLERAFISLARRKRERERERSWPGLIEIMLIKSRRGEKNNEDLVENQSVTRADS